MLKKRKFRFGFGKKIFLIMFLLSTLVLVISSSVIVGLSANLMKQDAIRYNRRMTEELSANIYAYFHDTEMRLSKIYTFDQIKFGLKQFQENQYIDPKSTLFAKDFYIAQLSDIDEIVGVNLFTNNDVSFSSFRKGHNKESVMVLTNDERLKTLNTMDQYWEQTGDKLYTCIYFDTKFNAYMMRIGIKVVDIYSGDYLGTFMVDRYAQEFQEMIQRYILYDNQYFSLTSSNGMILYPTTAKDQIVLNHSDETVSLEMEIEKYKSMHLESDLPIKSIQRNTFTTFGLVIVTVGVLLVIALLASLLFSKSLVQPLQVLTRKVELVNKGNNDIQIEVHSNDEVEELASGLNALVKRIVNLVNREYEQRTAMNRAHLKALQAQINPHFLHNTFQVMGSIARKYNAPILQKMCVSLSSIFRYNLDMKNMYTTLGDELAHARNYFYIQNIRYNNEIDYDVKCDIDAYGLLIPRLIIQPLIENAIDHGIRNKVGAKKILLLIVNQNNRLIIKISDNGCGFDEEQLEMFNSKHDVSILDSDESIGIRNVIERIRLTYKDDGRLSIKSKQGKGSEITIDIPCIWEGKQFAEYIDC